MSTLIELAESKVTITIVPKQGVIQSLVRDLATLSMIAFCVYISHGSTWWTFLTGLMFLFVLFTKLNTLVGNNSRTFKDKDAAIKYLKNLD